MEATVVVLATPPFWLATRECRWSSRPIMPDRLAQIAVGTGWLVPCLSTHARPTALVTGPTAGIGHAFAQQLAARGYDLVLVARDEERLRDARRRAARRRHGVEVEVLAADLTDRAELALVEAPARRRRPRPVDLLVNNAGFGLKGRFLDNSVDAEKAMLDVLVTAVMRLSHAALGPMAERGHGGIINVVQRGGLPAARAPTAPRRRG